MNPSSPASSGRAPPPMSPAPSTPAARISIRSRPLCAEAPTPARSILEARPGARLLDLGSGGGHLSYYAAPHAASVTAYDLSDEMLAAVAQVAAERGLGNIATRQGAVEALPFAAQSFDIVATRLSAHHWHDVPAALREARRVLAPGGLLVVIDIVSPGPPLLDTHFQAIELLRDPSHVRDYSAAGVAVPAPATPGRDRA